MNEKVSNVQIGNCAKILPLVYNDSLSYYETLCSYLSKLNEVIDFANSLTDDVVKEAKAYTDKAISDALADVDKRLVEVTEIVNDAEKRMTDLVEGTVKQFNQLIDDLQQQYFTFTQYVNTEIRRLDTGISDVNQKLVTSIDGVNNRTDIMIQQNNEWLVEEVAGNLPKQLTVYNILEGDKVSLQEMFDYLCNLHITDGIDIDTLVGRALTVNRVIAINRTVRDCVLYGNTILVSA